MGDIETGSDLPRSGQSHPVPAPRHFNDRRVEARHDQVIKGTVADHRFDSLDGPRNPRDSARHVAVQIRRKSEVGHFNPDALRPAEGS